MKRATIIILAAAAMLAITTAAVSAAGEPKREARVQAPTSQPRELVAAKRSAVRCGSLACLNHKLSTLYREMFSCMRVVGLTRYDGYAYTPDGINGSITTALDYTGPGSTPSDQFVVYVC